MREPDMSDPIIKFLRYLTSWEMQQDPDRYSHVIASQCDVPNSDKQSAAAKDVCDVRAAALSQLVRYCKTTVEVMGQEADHGEMTALSRCLRVPIEVESIANQKKPFHHTTDHFHPE
eukprot:scaffold55387_cov50-Prasinocladus_malaysianus.AAC.1